MNSDDVVRTLVVELNGVPRYKLDDIVCELPGRAAKLWAWLRKNADGWKFELRQIITKCRMSKATVWRAVTDLVDAGLMRRDDLSWTVTAPPCLTSETKKQGRAHAPARSSEEKEKTPTYSVERSNSAPPSAPVPKVGMSEQKDPDRSVLVQTQPGNAPSNSDRSAVPNAVRLPKLDAFLAAWSREFRDGPSSHAYMLLPSAWQQRVLWVWQNWTAEEIREAWGATVTGSPRNGWRYFCACLERIAAGRWNEERHAPAHAPIESANITADLRDEVAAQHDARSMPAKIRAAAIERGYDPDALDEDERRECIRAALVTS